MCVGRMFAENRVALHMVRYSYQADLRGIVIRIGKRGKVQLPALIQGRQALLPVLLITRRYLSTRLARIIPRA